MIAITNNAVLNATVNHGRGQPPRYVNWRLVCRIAEKGYFPGQEARVFMGASGYVSDWADAAQIGIIGDSATGGIRALNRTNSTAETITAANWFLKCYADF